MKSLPSQKTVRWKSQHAMSASQPLPLHLSALVPLVLDDPSLRIPLHEQIFPQPTPLAAERASIWSPSQRVHDCDGAALLVPTRDFCLLIADAEAAGELLDRAMLISIAYAHSRLLPVECRRGGGWRAAGQGDADLPAGRGASLQGLPVPGAGPGGGSRSGDCGRFHHSFQVGPRTQCTLCRSGSCRGNDGQAIDALPSCVSSKR